MAGVVPFVPRGECEGCKNQVAPTPCSVSLRVELPDYTDQHQSLDTRVKEKKFPRLLILPDDKLL